MKKLFTLIAAALMTLGANAQGTYAVGEDQPTDGQVVTDVPNITMTYGTGFKENKDDKSLTSLGFAYFTQGNDNPKLTDGVPTSGAFYKFEPAKNGTITVGIVLNADKDFFVTNGADATAFTITDKSGNDVTLTNNRVAEKLTGGIVKFDVKANNAYYVYCTGSKLGFYGFIYEVVEGGDEPGGDATYYMKQSGNRIVCLSAEEMSALAGTDVTVGYAPTDVTVLYSNEELTINAEAQLTFWPISWYTGAADFAPEGENMFINLGSSLAQNNWALDASYFDISTIKNSNASQSIISVTPKVDGVLGFGVYSGKNGREIGIYTFPVTDEDIDNENWGFVAVNDFRHDTPDGTDGSTGTGYYDSTPDGTRVANPDGQRYAPAFVEGAVKAGQKYLLLASQTNLGLCEITFTTGTTGIASVTTEGAVKNNAMYNLAGQRISAPVRGQIYIMNGKKYIAQ